VAISNGQAAAVNPRPSGAGRDSKIREQYPGLRTALMMFIVHQLGISGAARQTLEALQRDHSPTAFVFKCLHCDAHPVYVDYV
jgi:uncharacterized protein CbrC (UPF0167 family)